ncbi:MAG TPA: hypothetical protein VGI43_08480 [Mucilaginibacter sp.]|jgi:hypothetical protein
MITPENQIPYDDEDSSEAGDQQSQKDIHANGLDDAPEPGDTANFADPDKLQQAYDAAESSYTLNLDDEKPATKKKE